MAKLPLNPAEKLPPQNLEAEQSVLGSILIDKEAVVKIADILRAEDFYKDKHGDIYEAMLELYEKKEPIDILSLSSKLEEKKSLEDVGGWSYISNLANTVPTASNVKHYAEIIQKKATLRRLTHAATEIAELGFTESDEVETLLDKAEQKVFGISQKYLKQQFSPIKELLTEAFERIDNLHKHAGQLRGISTGYKSLDNKLGGLQKSDLVILAARPSMGKTSLALDIARMAATRHRTPVGIFSLEMSKDSLIDRMLCAESDVDLWKLRTGKLSDQEQLGGESDFSRIGHAMGTLAEAPIYIDDSPILNAMEIRTKARRLQSDRGLGLLIVDYLQLMEGVSNNDNRVQVVSEISRGLKAVARELDIPVLALSQLSRAVESRTTPIPKLADLRESGSIEQDADVVMFLYREEMYKKDTSRPHITEVHIAKHRNGPTGMIELYFNENSASFRNLEKTTPDLSAVPAEPREQQPPDFS